MGRTSKFTFPIPHRRQRPEPTPSISTPLTKAQKILGTGEISISIDSPTLPKDQSKQWETRSNSGISVTISESTASYNGTELGTVHEGRVTKSSYDRSRLMAEQESEIIPRILNSGPRSPGGLGYDLEDMITDASSIRRRQSSSTITSFYDKSKLPLSISQQTSNSAMAKGLPAKASALLDMDGTVPSPKTGKKKKPAMLDLSHLLPKHKSSAKAPQTQYGMALSPDAMSRSPSMMSVSPGITPPPVQQTGTRILRKKLTKESLRSQRSEVLSPQDNGIAQRRRANEATGLHNLYEHYEHASYRDVMNAKEQISRTPEKHQGPNASRTRSSSTNLLTSPSNRGGLAPMLRKHSSSGYLNGTDTPLTAMMKTPSVSSPPADCSASISSRHTRTSKASKRTDQSFSDLNLQQNSILSLSSDSEDDFPEPPKTALSVPTVNSREDETESKRPRTSRSEKDSVRNKELKHASFATKNQYLAIPERASVGPKPPPINARTSSLSTTQSGATSVTTGSSIRSSSRVSTLSSDTSTSLAGQFGPKPHADAQEALAITMIPAQGRQRSSPPRQQQASYRGSAQRSSRSSQPTPPLSPSSVDFYLRSQHNSISEETGSIRSSQSAGKAGHTSIDGRFMAVTKQEEMLLAALRIKRARMRETILAEFEEEIERVDHEQERSQSSASMKHSRRSSVSTVTQNDLQPRPARRDRSASNGRTAAGRSQPAAARSDPTQLNRLTTGHKHVLMYLDRPTHSMDAFDAAEPSPDLSDFMEFEETSNSDDFPYRPSGDHSPTTVQSSNSPASSAAFLAPPTNKWNQVSTRSRPDSTPLSPKSHPRRMALKDEDIRVRILEHPIDTAFHEQEMGIPRPDSPISPDTYLMEPDVSPPLPRKKAVRISAVGTGRVGMEAGWWDHDG